MTNFSTKKICLAQNLGARLKEAREDQGAGLEQAARDLNIAFKYLEALERNDLASLPGETYVKKFLQAYCDYLHLKFADCWNLAKNIQNKKNQHFDSIEPKYFSTWPRLLKKLLLLLVVLAVFFFLSWSVGKIFASPPLVIISPVDGYITDSRQIEIVGHSRKEAEIVINNQIIFVDDNGDFTAELDLQKGLNLIKITASKRYGRTNEAILRVLLR